MLGKWMNVILLPDISLLVHSFTSTSTLFSSGSGYHCVIYKAHRAQKRPSVKSSVRIIVATVVSNSWLNEKSLNNRRFIIPPNKKTGRQVAQGWVIQRLSDPFRDLGSSHLSALPSSMCQWCLCPRLRRRDWYPAKKNGISFPRVIFIVKETLS